MGDSGDMDELKRQITNVTGRVNVIERAFFGTVDESTNQFVPGLLQNSENTAKAMEGVQRWMRFATVAVIAIILVAAFPRLIDVVKVASALAATP